MIAISVCLIIAPMMSWYLVGLLVKIHLLEREMRQVAIFDPLTGFLRRMECLDRMTFFHNIATRDDLSYAVILADLDNFKVINDKFGHQAGDHTLEALGEAVREALRESDLACRYGGDEFIFFLPNTNHEQANCFAERLHQVIQHPIAIQESSIQVTASMGIACYPDVQANNINDFISAADRALYKAKKQGGNQTQHSSKL